MNIKKAIKNGLHGLKFVKKFLMHDPSSIIQPNYPTQWFTMNLKAMIKKGLLGYQPIFFPNGVISGAGFQFFGNLRSMRASGLHSTLTNNDLANIEGQDRNKSSFSFNSSASFNFNRGRLGNLYIPRHLGDRSEFNTEFYYCVDEHDIGHFAKFNLALLKMYEYFASKSMEIAKDCGCEIESMIEVGSNTCLFPMTFAEAGVKFCHGADIVDYSEVLNLLSAIKKTEVSFHHMPDDSDETWKNLPKADLVWSYAVLLHQSNPLAHLTRLASLSKKAIFVMTISDPEDWKSPEEMGLRYLSANSYYSADFPNCFDVTIVSPALIKYSLQRLGFSKVFEIPHPEFHFLDGESRSDLKYWFKKHSFYLAFRDTPRDVSLLDDYTIYPERSPYKGENVLVFNGYSNNVVLNQSRYYIVPHGQAFGRTGVDDHLQSFASLNNAMHYVKNLDSEKNPQPVLVKHLKRHNLIKFKHRVYLSPHGLKVNFENSDEFSNLSVLDSLEKWETLLKLMSEAEIGSLDGVLVEFVEGTCIIRTKDGVFRAKPLQGRAQEKFGDKLCSTSLNELVKEISLKALFDSINNIQNPEAAVFHQSDAVTLKRLATGVFQVVCIRTGALLSEHSTIEDAWCAALTTNDDATKTEEPRS